MKNKISIILILFISILLYSCAHRNEPYWDSQDEKSGNIEKQVRRLLEKTKTFQNSSGLTITYPYNETVFPPEITAPVFTWKDTNKNLSRWLITIEFNNQRKPIYAFSNEQAWAPSKSVWKIIKANSVQGQAMVSVTGYTGKDAYTVISQDMIRISTSTDRVDASIFYRQVKLPFAAGKKYFKQIKWRLGDISSEAKPSVVMENISVCASCHVFSKDGTRFSMEMNYRNDSAAQFITSVSKKVELTQDDFITWDDFPRPEILPETRGLFAKMSPGGKYIVSTVNEIAYMALTSDPAFCQLFFPTYGILAWYSVDEKTFHPLPGADNKDFIQTDPTWSGDEKYIAFSRTETRNEYHEDITNIQIKIEDTDIYELNKKFPIQFNIYRIAFNDGEGGTPEPVKGASFNGKSNYFPRYSPDGKWIVFTRSRTGIMLQPDSELYIVPSGGGEARRMRCNRALFNSWHSWSPNGKWLLFSSKVNTPYTEIFLTHVDENGVDSPPVCLSQFSDAMYAANLPEFVNIKPDAIEKIVIGEK